MKLFHIFTLIISITVFLGLFVFSAVMFYTSKSKLFPPDMAPCPDNWKMNADGRCKIPAPGPKSNLGYLSKVGRPIYVYSNIDDQPHYSYLPTYYDLDEHDIIKGKIDPKLPLGYYTTDIPHGYDIETPQDGSVDFTDAGWAMSGDPYCSIKKWAQTQNIQWDGILSYNNC